MGLHMAAASLTCHAASGLHSRDPVSAITYFSGLILIIHGISVWHSRRRCRLCRLVSGASPALDAVQEDGAVLARTQGMRPGRTHGQAGRLCSAEAVTMTMQAQTGNAGTTSPEARQAAQRYTHLCLGLHRWRQRTGGQTRRSCSPSRAVSCAADASPRLHRPNAAAMLRWWPGSVRQIQPASKHPASAATAPSCMRQAGMARSSIRGNCCPALAARSRQTEA